MRSEKVDFVESYGFLRQCHLKVTKFIMLINISSETILNLKLKKKRRFLSYSHPNAVLNKVNSKNKKKSSTNLLVKTLSYTLFMHSC